MNDVKNPYNAIYDLYDDGGEEDTEIEGDLGNLRKELREKEKRVVYRISLMMSRRVLEGRISDLNTEIKRLGDLKDNREKKNRFRKKGRKGFEDENLSDLEKIKLVRESHAHASTMVDGLEV